METYMVTNGSIIQRGIIYEIHCESSGFFTIAGIIHNAQCISGRVIRGPFIVKNPIKISADPSVSLIIFMRSTLDFSEEEEIQYVEFPCDQRDIELPLNNILKIDLIATAETARNIYRINPMNSDNFILKLSDSGQSGAFAAAFPKGSLGRIENFVISYETNLLADGIIHTDALSISSHRVGYYCCEQSKSKKKKSVLGMEVSGGKHHLQLEDVSINHLRFAGSPGTIVNLSSPEIRTSLVFTEDILDISFPISNDLHECHEFHLENSENIYLEVGIEE
ncbi:MAG: hypothetical protein DRO88_11945 [Promethearchaeia archaeon]|nr:MAG: hypothetical protein DRO88_11945 [Candidatus Lokiarchaeia archaeon]